MRESRPYGSVRGARGNSRPYRDHQLMEWSGNPPGLSVKEDIRDRRSVPTTDIAQMHDWQTYRQRWGRIKSWRPAVPRTTASA
jgi:hypothetical protein